MLSIRHKTRIKLERTEKSSRRISKLKRFIDKYNWKDINYPSGKMTGINLR